MWNGFPIVSGTEGLAETGARDVPAEPGLGRPHRHGTFKPALKTGCVESQGVSESSAQSGSLLVSDQVNVSEGGWGAAKAWRPVLDLGRDSGSVGQLWKAGEVAYSFIKQAADCRTQS